MSNRTGTFEMLRAWQARVIATNPHLSQKIAGTQQKLADPVAELKIRPIYEKGRYVPRSLQDLVAVVGRMADLHPDAICGNGRARRLVDARSCVAMLAQDFAPRLSAQAIDDGLLRGAGMTIWYRQRHSDRIHLYPEYGALYMRCLAALMEARP